MLFFVFCMSCFASIITHNGQCYIIPVEEEAIEQSESKSDSFRNDLLKNDSFARNVSFQDIDSKNPCESDTCQNGGTCLSSEDGFKCVCQNSYVGKTCEENVYDLTSSPDTSAIFHISTVPEPTHTEEDVSPSDDSIEKDSKKHCESDPCQNGGTCLYSEGGFQCMCQDPFFGKTCEKNSKNHCESDPCQNGGTCLNVEEGFQCMCQNPHLGKTCEKNLEVNCRSDPCQNGGICLDLEDGFMCMCQDHFFGKTCEKNPCSNNPCKNGGECHIEGEIFKCYCKIPFIGDTCERDPCTLNPCENGGQCRIDGNHFNCTCVHPYYGDMCEIGPCYPNPCQNKGECKVVDDNFKCLCESPFIGDTCEKELCSPNPCQNNGTCVHDDNNFKCSCIFPFYGVTCDKGPCTPNSCLNDGVCLEDGEKFMCMCKYPFHGDICEKGPCTPNPCLNGGVCKHYREKYKCLCKDSFYGDRCENEMHISTRSFRTSTLMPTLSTTISTSCFGNPCRNGGTCKLYNSKEICNCPTPYDGEFCEKSPCESNPCKNGGICKIERQNMKCMCLNPFWGKYCEKDPCYPNPCKNGGECKVTDGAFEGFDKGSYQCFCPESFSGDNCEIGMETTTQNVRTSTLITTMPTTPSSECDCGEKSSDCFVDVHGLKRCSCLPGYAQIRDICSDCFCGIQSLSCHFNSTGDKICHCKPGYGQKSTSCVEMCDSDKDCLNGGLCKRFQRDSFCECGTQFTGDKCEISTVCDELRERCKVIGAVCTEQGGRGTCECPTHKTYVLQKGFCEDICDSTKCVHGKCEIVGKSYRCRCDEGFSGSRCDEKIVANLGITGFFIFFLVLCNIIVTVLIGIFFCMCRNRRLKAKEDVQ